MSCYDDDKGREAVENDIADYEAGSWLMVEDKTTCRVCFNVEPERCSYCGGTGVITVERPPYAGEMPLYGDDPRDDYERKSEPSPLTVIILVFALGIVLTSLGAAVYYAIKWFDQSLAVPL